MVEDYRIKFHTGRAELTGQYTGKSKRQYKSNHQIYRTLCNTVGRVSPGDLERRSKRRDKGRWGDRTFRTG